MDFNYIVWGTLGAMIYAIINYIKYTEVSKEVK